MLRSELIIYAFNSKRGAELRIVDAIKNGEAADPRDIAMLENKPGRPRKDQGIGIGPFGSFDDWAILENYEELREHGIKYEDACEIAAHIHNIDHSNTIGAKTVRAIVTGNRNAGKKVFTQRYGEKAEEEWRRYTMEEKAYYRSRKAFWSRRIDIILSK